MIRFLMNCIIIAAVIAVANTAYGQGVETAEMADSTRSVTNEPDTLASKRLDEIVVTAELLKRQGNEDIITVTKAMREGTRNAGELLGRINGMFYNPLSTDLQYIGVKEYPHLSGWSRERGWLHQTPTSRAI